jgi:hypothetical protein
MHAEVSQLRAELESTRAVAARLAGLLRSRTGAGALVPVRDGGTSRGAPGQAAAPGPAGFGARPRPVSEPSADGQPAAAASHPDPG